MKENWIYKVAACFIAANVAAILASVISGQAMGQLAFRFEEKQAITFLSSNQLGATALVAWLVFILRQQLTPSEARAGAGFWAFSGMGFLYLMADESFQLHEGMDSAVYRLFGGQGDPVVDGAATAAYGLLAAALCYRYRREITRYPATLAFFLAGGLFLAATSVLNAGETTQVRIVIEETAKLLGVVCFLLGHLAAFAGIVSEVQAGAPQLDETSEAPNSWSGRIRGGSALRPGRSSVRLRNPRSRL